MIIEYQVAVEVHHVMHVFRHVVSEEKVKRNSQDYSWSEPKEISIFEVPFMMRVVDVDLADYPNKILLHLAHVFNSDDEDDALHELVVHLTCDKEEWEECFAHEAGK